MEYDLRGIKVAILSTDGFEESELLEPMAALEKAGAETLVISPKASEYIRGMHHDKRARSVQVDLPLEYANPDRFDALLLPGGALNADTLRSDKRAQEFVKRMDRDVKPIAFICHAPWILISAGLVKGKTLTGYRTIEDDVRNAGGDWVDKEVVRYGNWVSSRKPSDIPVFSEEMIKLFSEYLQRKHGAYVAM